MEHNELLERFLNLFDETSGESFLDACDRVTCKQEVSDRVRHFGLNDLSGEVTPAGLTIVYQYPYDREIRTKPVPLEIFRALLAEHLNELRGSFFYDNGQLRLQRQYVLGQREGCWIEWYENGQMRSRCWYVRDRLHGLSEQWCVTGVKVSEMMFENGTRHGCSRTWYDSSELKSETMYRCGRIQDGWSIRQWHPNGNIMQETYFSNGFRQEVKKYKSTGELVSIACKMPEGNVEEEYFGTMLQGKFIRPTF